MKRMLIALLLFGMPAFAQVQIMPTTNPQELQRAVSETVACAQNPAACPQGSNAERLTNWTDRVSQQAMSSMNDNVAHTLTILDSWRFCQSDGDCIIVDRGCSGCCDYDTISQQSVTLYQAEAKRACADYHGPVCECATPQEPYGTCDNGSCRLVFRPRQ